MNCYGNDARCKKPDDLGFASLPLCTKYECGTYWNGDSGVDLREFEMLAAEEGLRLRDGERDFGEVVMRAKSSRGED